MILLMHYKYNLIIFAISISCLIYLYIAQALVLNDPVPPPVAKRVPYARTIHNDTFIDYYAWLQNVSTDPDVLHYAEEENKHADSFMKASALIYEYFRQTLTKLFNSKVEDPSSYLLTSWEQGDYLYYTKYTKGYDWPLYFRRPLKSKSFADDYDDQLIFDTNKLAAGHNYFAIGVFEVSPTQNLVAFSYDTVGNEKFSVIFKNLSSDSFLHGVQINSTYYSVRWAKDSKAIFYNRVDGLGLPRYIYRFLLEEPPIKGINPKLVYKELDQSLTVSIDNTNDALFLILKISGQITSELRLISASDYLQEPRLVVARRSGIRYDLEHIGSDFFILTNDFASQNFVIMRSSSEFLSDPRRWTEVIAHSDERFLFRMEAFSKHLVVWFYENGLQNFLVYANFSYRVPLNVSTSEVVSVFPGTITDDEDRLIRTFATSEMVFTNSSFTQPTQMYRINLDSFETCRIAEDSYSGYERDRYCEQRRWVPSEEDPAILIPVSISYAKMDKATCEEPLKPRPLYLRGYGAYGSFIHTNFDISLTALLDLGFIVAIAHVRGDGDLGASWFESGKYERKLNSVSDFISCLRYFVQNGITRPELIAVTGRSAGGLVAGGAAVFVPDLIKAAVLQVPFIDPINDELNVNIPWVEYEWFEWGNPNVSVNIYNAMKRYSPYENAKINDYPNAFLLGGTKDARVGCYEPLKFIAQLRHVNKGNSTLLCRIYDHGHFATAAADGTIIETSAMYTFIVKSLNLTSLISAGFQLTMPTVVVLSSLLLTVTHLVNYCLFRVTSLD